LADGTTGWSRHRLALTLLVLVMMVWSAALVLALSAAALPDEASGTVAVVFAPGSSESERLAAVLDADGYLQRDTRFGNIWVVYGERPGLAGRLRAGGAWQVFEPAVFEVIVLPGCVPGLPLRGDA